jgi:hypothetical protein
MARFNIKVTVDFEFEFEADTWAEAEAEGWKYEDYMHHASVDSIDVDSLEDDDDEEENF